MCNAMQIASIKKTVKRKWQGMRGIAATKMEMRFAIGPCNFSNLNLILDARHDIETR